MHRVWIGVDSGVPATKQTRHHASIHCDDRRNEVQGTPALAVARECTLLLIQAEVPVHAPCLHSSRFGRPRREAHAVSCQRSTHGIMSDFAKGRFWPPSCEVFHSSRFGSSGLSDFFDRHHAKVFGLISCCRTCQVSEPWHTGLDSSLS